MKRYIFSMFVLVGSFVNVTAMNRNNNFQPQRLFTARVAAHVIFKKNEDAERFIKHSDFYAKKNGRSEDYFGRDNVMDYCVYPVVDNVVGRGMNQLNSIEPVHALTKNISKNISKDSKKFLADNIQLITSAGITRLVYIESTKGIHKINSQDVKHFGKSCAVQVGCDVVDKLIITPAVESIVEDKNSWTAWGLRGIGNAVFGQMVIHRVSQY